MVRERVIDTIRAFFKNQGFHEVFTPNLVPVPSSEPNLEVFETQLRTASGVKKRAFLTTSPEYAIKKLLAAGMGSCFEITKSFRNEEEITRLHNPEFTMLEWYRVGADYKAIMQNCENLFTQILGNKLSYQGENYDLSKPWTKISVSDAFEGKIPAAENFYKDFFNLVEPKLKKLKRPVIIYDYPPYQAALAKINKNGFAERFEIFLAGMELGNCFSELTDWQEQEKREKENLLERKKLGKTEFGIDSDFIAALKLGILPVAGIAVGVDRLVMLACDAATVGETMVKSHL